MRFYLISDNVDTQLGLRLTGIDGIVVHEKDEVIKALNDAVQQEDIGVILMTEKLASLCPELISDFKLNRQRPLITEIPDRHGGGRTKDAILGYIHDAIGLEL